MGYEIKLFIGHQTSQRLYIDNDSCWLMKQFTIELNKVSKFDFYLESIKLKKEKEKCYVYYTDDGDSVDFYGKQLYSYGISDMIKVIKKMCNEDGYEAIQPKLEIIKAIKKNYPKMRVCPFGH